MSKDRISLVNYFNNRRGNNRVELFYIPPYQRPYEWTWGREERGNAAYKLYKDIRMASITQMGIILLHRDVERDRINIIDGQQRLITFSLFVKALLTLKEDCIRESEDEELGEDEVLRLKTCLYQLNNRHEPTTNLRLQLSAANSLEDARSFGDIIRGDGEPVAKPKDPYGKVYKGIYEALSGSNDKDCLQFAKNLNKIGIWTLEVDDKKLAWEVFQTLNRTGKALDAADFVKGQLFEQLQTQLSPQNIREEDLAIAFKNKWEGFATCLDGTCIGVRPSRNISVADELLQFYSRVSPWISESNKMGEDIVRCFSNGDWKLISNKQTVFNNFNAIEIFFKIIGTKNIADLSHQRLNSISKICLWILKNIKYNFKFYMPIFVYWSLDPSPRDLECFLKGMVAYWVACNVHLEEFGADKQKENLIRIIDSIYTEASIAIPVASSDKEGGDPTVPRLAKESEIKELLLHCYRYGKLAGNDGQKREPELIKTLLRIYGFLILNKGNSKEGIPFLEDYTDADHIVPKSMFETYPSYLDRENSGNSIGNLIILSPDENNRIKGEKTDPRAIIEVYENSINPDAREVAGKIKDHMEYQSPSEEEIFWWTNRNIDERIGEVATAISQWCKKAIEEANAIGISAEQKNKIDALKTEAFFPKLPLHPLSWEEMWTNKNIVYFELELKSKRISRSVKDFTEAFLAIAEILNVECDLSQHVGKVKSLSDLQEDKDYSLIEGGESLWIDTKHNNEEKKKILRQLLEICQVEENQLTFYTV